MQFHAPTLVTQPRRVKMPVADPAAPALGVSAAIPALAQFFKADRDTIDFGIDFSDWLVANGSPQVTNCVYAAAAGSPAVPTIAAQDYNAQGETVVVLSGGTAGDAYWIDCTLTMDAVQLREGNPNKIISRVLVRRLHIVVYKD